MIAKLKMSSQLEKHVSSKLLDISRAHLHYRIRRSKGSLSQKQRILLRLSVVSWYNTQRCTRFHSTVSCLCVKHRKSETSRFARTSVLLTITSTSGHCGWSWWRWRALGRHRCVTGSSRGQSTRGLSLDITPGSHKDADIYWLRVGCFVISHPDLTYADEEDMYCMKKSSPQIGNDKNDHRPSAPTDQWLDRVSDRETAQLPWLENTSLYPWRHWRYSWPCRQTKHSSTVLSTRSRQLLDIRRTFPTDFDRCSPQKRFYSRCTVIRLQLTTIFAMRIR